MILKLALALLFIAIVLLGALIGRRMGFWIWFPTNVLFGIALAGIKSHVFS